MSHKELIRELELLTNDIRNVLLEKWDPIGVHDEPLAQDEYDAYIGVIVRMLKIPSVTAEEISDYLKKTEREAMGLDGNPDRCLRAAEELI